MVPYNIFKMGPRAILWALAAATFCGGSFLGIAGALSLLRGSQYLGSENLFFTSICAPIAWVFVAVFLFGTETIQLPTNQAATFLENACRVLEEMGYHVSQSGDTVATRGAFRFMLFGRGIQIHCLDRQARVSGPKLWVDALRRRLRVQNFLSASDLSLHDSTVRGSSVLLKRVQIQMRVSPASLAEINRNVLQVLAQDADVVCEVSLLAQSEQGIHDSTVEQIVRPWLSKHGIAAEIHKDIVKMSEPPATMILPSSRRRGVPVA